jgi:serine phosphatase RsbU (regulator of sigma subunit)
MLDVAADRTSVDLYLAGHPVPLLLGEPSALLPTHGRGRALGIPVSGGWSPVRLELAPSWRILLYTDGVLEATIGGSSDRVGKTGLLRIVDGAVAARGDLVERVLHDVRELHGGDLVDDAAVVVLGWRA